jgi:serine/threonine protein kinase/tetratricopeptide (TPR) repeat protein
MPKLEIDARTWAELNHLLDLGLDQPPSERNRWIDALAPQYAALKPRLRDLLSRARHTQDSAFLNTLPKFDREARDSADAGGNGDRPGDTVGHYRLVRELGSGGMGAVWLAERLDGLINRQVALKLPHGAWKRAGLAERMGREREILAALAHPNIARLYDAGITAEGRPFLAIEYIEGRQIDEYCRVRQADLHARLRLFAQVANAVAYAHAKLIVHRDLKPANILVTADGQVRLLDFGIAKLLQDGQANDARLTEVSGCMLTPDYASPEQILGEPLTIASDVYSLGVILFELLCQRRPYTLARGSRRALENAIVGAEPARPSEVARVPWRASLRGDLDTIVLKALKKTPETRYATVHAFVDDIARYLTSRPVLAQPDRLWYRVHKFVARNRLAVGAAGATVTAVLAGAGVAAWQAKVALAQKARAEEVKEFIASVFREADPTQGKGKVLSAAELLRQAERRLHDRSDADPAIQVELLAIIGESLFGLQDNADSARVIEQALRLQAAAGVRDTGLNARLHLVLSQSYEYLGNHEDARRELERALSVLAALGDTTSPLFIEATLHQAALGIVFSDYAAAEHAACGAIRIASETLGPRSTDVATGLQLLSHIYTLTQRRELAVEPARRSFEIALEIHANDATHPRVMESTQYYAQALHCSGDFRAASALFRDFSAKSARVFGDDSRSFGESLSAVVPADIDIGELTTAIANARRAIEIYFKEGKPGSATHAGRVRKLGAALLAARATSEAAERLEEALRLSIAAKSELDALHARGSFGLALAYLGRFEEADRHLRQAIDETGPASARARHLAMRNLGTLLRLQGRYVEALQWLEQSNEASARQPSHRGDHAHGLLEAGLARLELGEVDTAEDLLTRAEAIFEDVQQQRATPARADLRVGMARVRFERRNYLGALRSAEHADRIWRDFDQENRWAGEAALWLGRAQLALGRKADAIETLNRAARILSRSPLPADVPLVELTRMELSAISSQLSEADSY